MSIFNREDRPFYPLTNTTAPSFRAVSDNNALSFALESTLRVFQGPAGRSVRITNSDASANYYILFGSSTVVATSTNGILMLGGVPFITGIAPSQTYISIVSSTSVAVNITLGYGG